MSALVTAMAGTVRAIAVGLAVIGLACADSDEAWLLRASLPPGTQPLLALIIDSSGSTFGAGEPFSPERDYAADLAGDYCDPSRIYWRRGPGPAPDCTAQAGLEPSPASHLAGLRCEAARGPLAQQGFFIASRAAQWRGPAGDGFWSALSPDSRQAVECRSDRGRHGAMAGTWYATDGTAGPWATQESAEIDWDRAPHADPYIFYGGNYLNYLRSTRAPTETPIADAINRSLAAALSATDELEIALIRVDGEASHGGYVARAPVPAASAAAELLASARGVPGRSAPLAEALSETAAWLGGHAIRFGDHPNADHAAVDSLAPGRYRSPIAHACRPVTLAYLTAGLASGDDLAATAAAALPRFTELTAGCGASCLPAIAQWVGRADLRDDLPGDQSAALHWLTPRPVAELIAQSAGAGSVGALDDPLEFVNLVARSLQRDAAVPGNPQFSAAGTMPLADPADGPGLVYGLTVPLARQRWVGNLFRYGLRAADSPLAAPTIIDRDGEPAIVSATGLPKSSSRSYWSDTPDANLLAGGAAGKLPVAEARRIYSDLASSRMLDPANRLSPDNLRLDRAVFGLGSGDPESPAEIVAWLADQRMLGDPGPHAPVIVHYPPADRELVFAVTQDGMLHALDADSGVEAWAWLPKEMLPRLVELMRNESTTVRSHGIDGPMILHRHDPDGDGRIDREADEHLWLLFGLGRGGRQYYAIDVATADDPRLLWSIALPAAGEIDSRAKSVITRLAVAGSGQSAGDWVVLLAGGHDRRFGSAHVAPRGDGNALHVVDALTGRVVWTASGDATPAPDLAVGGLASSAASAPRALDLDGDGYLDRAYLVDVTGGLWRFDFTSGRPANEVASARQLARLGDGTRRFHATPDASLVRIAGATRVAIAFGSGWLSRPRDTTIIDRFYVILDEPTPAGPRMLTEADLHEVTDEGTAIPPSAPGWFMRLERYGAGEKVIGPAVTFDHAIRFQTYQPLDDDAVAPCGPPQSIRRLYALDIRDGRPHASAVESGEDEEQEIGGSGLPVGLRFGFPGRRDALCEECPARAFGVIGAETFDAGYAGDPVRTSWRKLRPPPDSP